jgi:hypothetical protein
VKREEKMRGREAERKETINSDLDCEMRAAEVQRTSVM